MEILFFATGSLSLMTVILIYLNIKHNDKIIILNEKVFEEQLTNKHLIDIFSNKLEDIKHELLRHDDKIIKEVMVILDEKDKFILNISNEVDKKIDVINKDVIGEIYNELSDINKIIEEKMITIDDKLIETKKTTYFDFNKLLDESVKADLNNLKHDISKLNAKNETLN
jgi:hypothetical protein